MRLKVAGTGAAAIGRRNIRQPASSGVLLDRGRSRTSAPGDGASAFRNDEPGSTILEQDLEMALKALIDGLELPLSRS